METFTIIVLSLNFPVSPIKVILYLNTVPQQVKELTREFRLSNRNPVSSKSTAWRTTSVKLSPGVSTLTMLKKQKRKNEQGCTRATIIGQCTCCVIWKLSPAPCNALYELFGAEQFYIMQTGNTNCMNRFNIKWEILYSANFHRKSKTCECKWHTV